LHLLWVLVFALFFLIQCFLQVHVHRIFLVPPSCRAERRSQHKSPRGPLECAGTNGNPYVFQAHPRALAAVVVSFRTLGQHTLPREFPPPPTPASHLSFYFIFHPLCVHAQSLQLCLTLCDPRNCSPPGFSVQLDSSGKNTGVGCHALLQGIFLT